MSFVTLAALFACDPGLKELDSADDSVVTDPTSPAFDGDLDGVTVGDGDCDDANASVHPGAVEVCDSLDNDCDEAVDEGLDRTHYADVDGDGFGDPEVATTSCYAPPDTTLATGDCDDTNPAVHPGAAEVCDGEVDEDCDGLLDAADPDVTDAHTYYSDADGDTYGDPASLVVSCDAIAGTVTNDYDCDDTDAARHPHADEVCDERALDDDCDGLVDDADPESVHADYWPDADGDGFGDDATAVLTTCFDPGGGFVGIADDCDDLDALVNPAATEVCDDLGVDEDCDGAADEADTDIEVVPWWVDGDGDGYGADGTVPTVTCEVPAGSVARDGDCDDADPAVNAGAGEVCDATDVDDDCDGLVDEDDPETPAVSYYVDTDGDGYGDSATVVSTCETVTDSVTKGGDCDETDAAIHPGAFDDCANGVDDDCDGTVDECAIGSVNLADADLIVTGSVAGGASGCTLRSLGDVNGDGTPDLGISAYATASYTGAAHVIFGPATGSIGTTAADVEIVGPSSGSGFAISLSGKGDADGDGRADLMVGAPWGDRAYLFYGPTTADRTAAAADATFTATAFGDWPGYGVDFVGDWDGDGNDEVSVSAPYADGALTTDAGAIYLFQGPTSGTISATTADYTFFGAASDDWLGLQYGARAALGDTDGDGTEDLTLVAQYAAAKKGEVYVVYGGIAAGTYDVGTDADATVTGESAGDYIGCAVADRVDYDGDGHADLVTGSFYNSSGATEGGATYVFLGPVKGAIAAADADAVWTGKASDWASYTLAAGNFDDDGHDDLLIGAYHHTAPGGGTQAGTAYVALGAATGTHDLGTEAYASFDGSTAYDYAGMGVTLVDDWDGDGYGEVAIGAHGTGSYNGTTWLFSGSSLR
jgi:hypothetical protein